VREHVRPGVTHVGQGELLVSVSVPHERQRSEGRPHAAKVRVGLALVPHRSVRLGEGLPETTDRRCPLERLVERLDCDPRRHLATDVTAHAVGDGVEVRPDEGQILVDGADPADVCRRPGAQHGHFDTSNTVEPICRRSPLPSRTAWVIRSEFTKVPFVEPRSSIQSWSLRRKRRAWSVEV